MLLFLGLRVLGLRLASLFIRVYGSFVVVFRVKGFRVKVCKLIY